MSSALDVLGVGYPSMDYMIKLDSIPNVGKTSTILSKHMVPNYGGCVINITYLLSEFGFNCGVYMTVGKDFEESGFKNFLENQSISFEYMEVDPKRFTSYTVLLETPDEEHITLFSPGAMEYPSKKQRTDFTSDKVGYGLITIGELETNNHFLDNCIRNEIPIIFSMKGDYSSLNQHYLEKIFRFSKLIFMNELEYRQLNSLLGKEINEYLHGEQVFVVTLGSKGCVVLTQNEKIFVDAFDEVNVVDTTGGGDAFIAGFLCGYLNNHSLRDSAEIGAALSSFIIEKIGCLTNIPNKSQLLERKIKIGELYNNDKADIILRTYK
ncbi:hypothetical protein I4Q36_07280 [Tuanshanicoccus lijuaniae]|uniref:PfkB family carbohydrate kinase n=1 Tax=Aerococcaceae bacterium zg-1292 TaxID=2774330 RepID=UPI001938669D|nr:hypothetical protein [Aerococcaceae bacterium zg-1292]QQA36610.1 hypothetical protein I4Q36_07280 [Aerococcaceae bacterium zg-1292]